MSQRRPVFLPSLAALGLLAGCVDRSESSFYPDVEPFPDGGRVITDRALDGGFVQKPARLDQLLVAERPPPALSGGTLSVSADGKIAVAADPDRDALYVVELDTAKLQTVQLAQGSEPGRVVLDEGGRAHVALRGTGKIARVDLATGSLVSETDVCKYPRGLAHDAKADALWVACASGELVSLGAADHAERSRSFVALDLRDVVVTPQGERFVSRYRSAELLHFDAQGKWLGTEPPPTTVSVTARGSVRRAPTLAWRTQLDPQGKLLMLHQSSQLDEVSIEAPGGYGGSGGCGAITQAAITRYGQEGTPTSVLPLSNPALTVDVALSPDGTTVASAVPGAYLGGTRGSLQLTLVSRLQPATQVKTAALKTIDAGVPRPAPDGGFAQGSFDAGVPCTVFTVDQADDVQVTAVAFAGNDLLAFSREPARLRRYAIDGFANAFQTPSLVLDLELSQQSVRDTGHELFHADVGGGLACASCHGEALDDGHVWTFSGFGARRTQTMRGGMLSTLPLHWEGDMPTFEALVDEVMTRRMGGFSVERKYADALSHWIDAQPELALDAADATAATRGKALFESSAVGCASCHAGAMLTNNTSVDVGTGGVFQVPSLRGLGLRAPYMHDGCAATLRARFDPGCGGGDAHGKTAQLTAAEIGDLVAYLQTL